jgi:hypothetical protein
MRTATLMITATLALGLATAAQAQYPSSRGYDGRGRNDRVAALADEVQDTASYIRRGAERNNRRPNRDEARMLAQLAELDQEAREFHREVAGYGYHDSYRRDGRGNRRDFRELVRTYQDTWDVLDRTGRRSYIDRGMVRIGSLLREISGYYGESNRWYRDNGRYGRRDRDYGDRWRYRDDDRYDRDDRYDGRRPR